MKDWPGYCKVCGKVTSSTADGKCLRCGAQKAGAR